MNTVRHDPIRPLGGPWTSINCGPLLDLLVFLISVGLANVQCLFKYTQVFLNTAGLSSVHVLWLVIITYTIVENELF